MAEDWSEHEVRIAVEAYFQMLEQELRGESFNKTEIRRGILPRLENRSNGSLEFKNCNISAALLEMGYPSILGYKPRWNYQRGLLPTVIERAMANRPDLLDLFRNTVNSDVVEESPVDYASVYDPEPPEPPTQYGGVRETKPIRKLSTPNYLEIEARNRSLGLKGEELVVKFERQRLMFEGKERLAHRVEHISVEKGDGAGFDVRSFDTNGSDLFIEVKTTRFRKEAPFFVTANELDFSTSNASAYALYRVYQYERSPRLFQLRGRLSNHCNLDATEFRASFR